MRTFLESLIYPRGTQPGDCRNTRKRGSVRIRNRFQWELGQERGSGLCKKERLCCYLRLKIIILINCKYVNCGVVRGLAHHRLAKRIHVRLPVLMTNRRSFRESSFRLTWNCCFPLLLLCCTSPVVGHCMSLHVTQWRTCLFFEHDNCNNDWILGISVDSSWVLTWFVQIRVHASCVFMSYKEEEFTSTEEIKSKWSICFPWGFVFYSSWLELLFVAVICIDYSPIGSSM